MSALRTGTLPAVLEALEVTSPLSFRLAGRAFEATPPASGPGEGPALLPLLRDTLYQHAYVRPFAGRLQESAHAGDGDLLHALRAAHPGQDRWDPGWEVVQTLPTGRVVARRGAVSRFLWPGEFVSLDGPGMPPRPGAGISLWMPREAASLQPGFFFVFGAGRADGSEEGTLVRIYWNVSPEGAPDLLGRLAARLDRFGVPFRFKCLSRRRLYPRSDAAVLYLARRHTRLAVELSREVRGTLGGAVGTDVPLFTLPLAPGLALAEDPDGGESFGMHRCGVVAEGVWRAFEGGRTSAGARMEEVEAAFQRRGLDPDRPWLGAGSPDRYTEVARAG